MTITEMAAHLQKHYPRCGSCSIEDVEDVEQYYNITLPLAYKVFLLLMGNGAFAYDPGSEWEYHWLHSMKESADKIFIKSGLPALPQHTFVYWMHQGYQFCYFDTDAGDNPPVYYYNECFRNAGIIKLSETLTEILAKPGIRDEVLNNALKDVVPSC